MMIYLDIFKKLNDEEIDYLVVGGVALVLHGAVRLTADLDLMIMPEPENLQRLVCALEDLGYKPKLPILPSDISFEQLREWKKNRNLQVLAFYNSKLPLELIDILIDPVVDYKNASAKKETIEAKGIRIPVISINDLITLKEEASRPQDLADIETLNNVLESQRGEDDK